MSIETVQDFKRTVAEVQARPGYRRPAAFGLGWAVAVEQPGGELKILEVWFDAVSCGDNLGAAAMVADVLGASGTGTYTPNKTEIRAMLERFKPFEGDGKDHPNIEALKAMLGPISGMIEYDRPGHVVVPVVVFLTSLDELPKTAGDAYLRLYLLSMALVEPRGVNLDKIFVPLNTVAWTDRGPVDPDLLLPLLRDLRRKGEYLHVYSLDKFPPMLDYVVPPEIRIGDSMNVRIGAQTGPGTTVMYTGYINMGGATGRNVMVEGSVSHLTVAKDGAELGQGCGAAGTLAGGGRHVVTIGEKALVGSLAGIGFEIGPNCAVSAGLYVLPGMPVVLLDDDDEPIETVKAETLVGRSNLWFRWNTEVGRVEVKHFESRDDLTNAMLHHN